MGIFMCYVVYISTDSPEDLEKRSTELVRFEKLSDPITDPCTALLEFGNRWFVGSKSQCSCTFRHSSSFDLGFSEPVDWYPEEQDQIDATRELYSTLDDLLSSGYRVDLIDLWNGTQPQDIASSEVSCDVVSSTQFRMFENHRFRLTKGSLSRESPD